MITIRIRVARELLLAALLMGAASLVQAASQLAASSTAPTDTTPKVVDVDVCLFDPRGRSGDLTTYVQDLDLAARNWGIRTHARPYVDEMTAIEDFKASQCDVLVITTQRTRQFNRFIGSFDALGGIRNYTELKLAIQLLFESKKLAPRMVEGNYEVVALLPVGGVYMLTRDKQIDSIAALEARKVAVLNWDTGVMQLLGSLGAHVISADLSNFGGMFKAGQVEAITAPALAYQPMELSHGVEPHGAVINQPLFMMTGAVIVNRRLLAAKSADFEERIAKLRQYIVGNLDPAFEIIHHAEQEIPPHAWLQPGETTANREDDLLRATRIRLTQDGWYDALMMHFLKRIRCASEPGRAECFESQE
jgi:hypothetical protein